MDYIITEEECSASLHRLPGYSFSSSNIAEGSIYEPYIAVSDNGLGDIQCSLCGKKFNDKEIKLIKRNREKLSKLYEALEQCKKICPTLDSLRRLDEDQQKYCVDVSIDAIFAIKRYYEDGKWMREEN